MALEIASRFLTSASRLTSRGTGRALSARQAREHLGVLLDGLHESLAQPHLGLPPEQLPGPRDVRLAHLRVVLGKRLEDHLRARLGELDHELGHLEQAHLVRVPDVHRVVHVGGLVEGHQAADQVLHVTEAAGLGPVSEDRHRLAVERLAQEGRHGAPVVGAHPRAVGVEDPCDAGVHALLAQVGHRERLGVALGLVVHAARADRVHVAPVGLRLRVHERIAVHLAGGGDQEAGAVLLREARACCACRRPRP